MYPRGVALSAPLVLSGNAGRTARSVSRSSLEARSVRRLTLLAFAPTRSSRRINDALARRRAVQAGPRRNVDPRALQSANRQTAVDNEDLIREALAYRGAPYVRGGASRGGFDCSGFALYIYRRTRGIVLPHHASQQIRRGVPVARSGLRPGDLVFFRRGRGVGHVGIYIGQNKFIHAANPRSNVRVNTLTGWYASHYAGARRLSPAPLPTEEAHSPPGVTAVSGEAGPAYLDPPADK